MSKNKVILETFLSCPNCGKRKNANYTPKQDIIKVSCFCGTELTKQNPHKKCKTQ